MNTHEALSWLTLLLFVLLVLIVPTWLYERWARSDYKDFVRYRKALAAQRDDYHTTWNVK